MKYLTSALLGAILACTVGVKNAAAQDIAGTNTIILTDFDNSPSWTWGYAGDYSWGSGAPPTPNWVYVPLYSEATNVCYGFWFTNAPYEPLVTGGGGYGIYFGGPGFNTPDWDPSTLSTNLYDYIFSFDARAEGMTPGQATANGEMQLQWNPANLFECNFGVTIPSNWTHYAWLLSDADSYTGGSGNLSNWVYQIQNQAVSGAQWNFNTHLPQGWCGWDDNNAVFIDNFRLDMIIRTGAPPVVVVPPTVPRTIFEWNMDDKPLNYTYGGQSWSAIPTNVPTYTYSANTTADMAGYGMGGSNGLWLLMDNTVLAPPNTPAWAGGQNGCNGPTDFSVINNNDPKHFVFECDARVQGVDPSAANTATTVDCQLFLDGAPGGSMQFNFSVPADTNWVHSALDFTTASWPGGAAEKASFATNYNKFTNARIQWQINSAPNGAYWGFDNNNRLITDNMKLTHDAVGCPPLRILTETNNVIVAWGEPSTGTTILLSGDTVTGVTNVVAGVTNSPYVIPIASAPKYFRTQWVQPTP